MKIIWLDFTLPPINLWNAPRMNQHYRNHAADRRANSLKLNPRPAQTNSFRHFTVSDKKATDIDLADHDRMNTLLKIKNRRIYK